MARQLATKCRESATLIMVAKDVQKTHQKFDYKVLLFNRAQTASFMPNSAVFPGGVYESTDESPLWLEHFRSFGVNDNKLKDLTLVNGPRPSIFGSTQTPDGLPKEISLRITAIRETFEEVGILLCRNRKTLGDMSGYGHALESLDRARWQHLVHNDHTQFFNLCRELDVLPDLWNLHEWSTWLTPSTFKKRFETAFYLVALEHIPEVLVEENEATDYAWMSPEDYLEANRSKKLWLPPPQLYELSRLLNLRKISQLREFAQQRGNKGSSLLLPVIAKCKDGSVSLYPGDDSYPSDPYVIEGAVPTEVTMAEFRADVQRLHRTEFFDMHTATVHMNVELEDGQLTPLNLNRTS